MAAKKTKPRAKPVADEERHEGHRKPAAEVLEDLAARGLAHDVQVIAMRFACTPLEVCSTSRQAPIPDARAELWAHLYSDKVGWSLPRIGEIFDADHSTVAWQLKNRKKRLEKEAKP